MRVDALKLVLVAGLVATAACSKKKEDLPPPPPPPAQAPAPVEAPPAAPTGAVTSTVVPGSVADFVAQAGSDRVFFAYDSYELDEAARATLDKQAAWLARYPNVRMTIEGHADERGTREYNLALGDRRANATKNYLAAKGVDAGRIATISYGKERPAVQGSDEESYAQNRRAVTALSGAAS
ncbi:MAG: peptidoglycan-associated lipoprotein Pal [Alphaproteobacteria bacterium]|nr:peptidoglycan-associated lipoprotein Pal [Alphaproteobacteria bacterium]